VKVEPPLALYPPTTTIAGAVIVAPPLSVSAFEALESTSRPQLLWMLALPLADTAFGADASVEYMQFGPVPSYATARADTLIELTPSALRKKVGSSFVTIASTYAALAVFGPELGGLWIATVTLLWPSV
jgi:hypothetical protein